MSHELSQTTRKSHNSQCDYLNQNLPLDDNDGSNGRRMSIYGECVAVIVAHCRCICSMHASWIKIVQRMYAIFVNFAGIIKCCFGVLTNVAFKRV